MLTTDPAAPRSWTFLDASALKAMLALSLDVEARFSSGFPEPGEQAVRTVITGFSELLEVRRPPFVQHAQPRAHLLDHWWCTGVFEPHGGTVVVLCIPRQDETTLEATLGRALQHKGHVHHAWLGIGTLDEDGVLPTPLQTIGCSLLLRWPKTPDDPQHLALLDLAAQTARDGLHAALNVLERGNCSTALRARRPSRPPWIGGLAPGCDRRPCWCDGGRRRCVERTNAPRPWALGRLGLRRWGWPCQPNTDLSHEAGRCCPGG